MFCPVAKELRLYILAPASHWLKAAGVWEGYKPGVLPAPAPTCRHLKVAKANL